MLSGLFFAITVLRHGLDRFRQKLVNRAQSDLRIGRWWNVAMLFVVVEALVLLVWWLSQAVNPSDVRASLTPLSSFNVGTVLVQGGIVIAILLTFNRRLARGFGSPDED